jgi:hypothetical protein
MSSAIIRVFLFLGLAALTQAQNCSNSSWSGTQYFLIAGTAPSAANVPVNEVQLGKLTADGNGHLTGTATQSASGTIASLSLAGTYSVTIDCSGSQTLTVNSPGAQAQTSYSTFELIDGAQQKLTAVSDPGAILTGRAYRAIAQSPSQCSDASLVGNYAFLGSSPTLGTSAAFSFSGEVVFDGNGGLRFTLVPNDSNPGYVGTSSLTGQGTYSVAGDCSGSAAFNLSAGSIANYNFAIVDGGNVLFMENDPGTVFYGLWQPNTTPLVLPQFAFGGGWYSALYFANTTSAAVSFPVNFIADNGTALFVLSLGASSTNVNIPAQGSAIVEATNNSTLNQGYASFSLPPGVSGYGIFRQTVAGRPDQEAVAPFVAANKYSGTLVWDDTSFVTSVAMVNAGPVNGSVSITVWDNSGRLIGTTSVSLPAHQKTEAALRTLPGLATMAGSRGTAQFVATSGNIAVLGLRFNSAFTSIPVN